MIVSFSVVRDDGDRHDFALCFSPSVWFDAAAYTYTYLYLWRRRLGEEGREQHNLPTARFSVLAAQSVKA